MTTICPDCGQPMASSASPQPPGASKGKGQGAGTPEAVSGAVALRSHWLTCASPVAMQRRIRSGLEPGYIPITFGRIKAWEECAFREQQENRVPDRIRTKSDKADLGTAVHLIMQARQSGGSVDDTELSKLVPLDMAGDFDYLRRSAEKLTVDDKREHMLFLEDEARMRWEFPIDGLEGPLIAQVEVKPDVLKIFTAEPLAEVVDYKTGRAVNNSVEEDDQGQLYCAVLSETELGARIEWFDFIQPQLRFWDKAPSVRWSRAQINAFKERFMAKVQLYALETEFRTRPGNWCHWCPVAFRCPEGQKLLKTPVKGFHFDDSAGVVIDSNDTARQLAQTVIQMQAAVQQINDWLREWVKLTEQNIDMGDGTDYGYQIKTSLKLPPEAYEKAREILAEKGFNFDDYVRWDMQEGDGWKFIKGKRGREAGLLKDLAKPSPYARWELSKKEEE